MIPTATNITEFDDLPGIEVDFSIGNPIWVMKNLAALYSDSTTAPIREISTNAMDSHIMAGKADVPIHVSLPTMMDPYFVVEDFGLGLSEDQLLGMYTQFGESTKRESNDVNGMYGFGSKAPLAYTQQFTVVARKDGKETHAVVSRRPDWSMTLKVVSVRDTDEGNGVKITIPVHNRDEFVLKAKNFYRFWLPGTVLVNGEQPVQAVGEKIEDNLYFSPNPGVSYVVMGNVGYRIENPDALFRNSRMNSISFVVYVPGGSVEHTPSREDLDYTDLTKKTLTEVIQNFEARMVDTAKKQIENATDHIEAWKTWRLWGTKLGYGVFDGIAYKGIKLVHSFSTPLTVRYKTPYGGYSPRYNTDRVHSVEVEGTSKALFVTNFYPDLQTAHKKKAREWALHVGVDAKYIYFMKGDLTSPWVEAKNIVTWDHLKDNLPKAPKKPRASGPRRPKGLFDFFTKNGRQYAKPIPDQSDIFYITASDANKYEVVEALKATKADDNVVVIILAVNRVEKFTRDNFGAREFMKWAKARVIADGESLLDNKSKNALNLSNSVITWLKRLDATKIDDPAWKAAAELLTYRAYTDKYNDNLTLARCLGMRYDVKEYRAAGDNRALLEKYPLLERISFTYNVDDVVRAEVITYINAAYAAKKGKP